LKHLALNVGAITDREENTRTVLAFYEHAVKHRNFAAAARFLAPAYIQHRNDAGDGAEGTRQFINRMRVTYPHSH
jgi:predicted SnoaL-like aldol condensation-catalyzing enzyme